MRTRFGEMAAGAAVVALLAGCGDSSLVPGMETTGRTTGDTAVTRDAPPGFPDVDDRRKRTGTTRQESPPATGPTTSGDRPFQYQVNLAGSHLTAARRTICVQASLDRFDRDDTPRSTSARRRAERALDRLVGFARQGNGVTYIQRHPRAPTQSVKEFLMEEAEELSECDEDLAERIEREADRL